MIRIYRTSSKYGPCCIKMDYDDFPTYQQFSWHVWGSARHNSLYFVAYDKKKDRHYRFHRIVMQAPAGKVVDHINGNALDNRRCNLRVCSQGENNKNAKKRRNARTSKFKGVSYRTKCYAGKPWVAQIQVNKKKIYLGNFSTETEAAIAYNNAASMYFTDFAVLNPIKRARSK